MRFCQMRFIATDNDTQVIFFVMVFFFDEPFPTAKTGRPNKEYMIGIFVNEKNLISQ